MSAPITSDSSSSAVPSAGGDEPRLNECAESSIVTDFDSLPSANRFNPTSRAFKTAALCASALSSVDNDLRDGVDDGSACSA